MPKDSAKFPTTYQTQLSSTPFPQTTPLSLIDRNGQPHAVPDVRIHLDSWIAPGEISSSAEGFGVYLVSVLGIISWRLWRSNRKHRRRITYNVSFTYGRCALLLVVYPWWWIRIPPSPP
jgi:hypothetical protein